MCALTDISDSETPHRAAGGKGNTIQNKDLVGHQVSEVFRAAYNKTSVCVNLKGENLTSFKSLIYDCSLTDLRHVVS